ncbi:MAG TPA: site-2 protease family protein [Steroidobacteraceae bacterium]|jgi:Zn-dependent protease
MASHPPDLNQECPRCKGALAPNALVCSDCHALVHASTLEQLAARARLHEEHHEFREAREAWVQALELLPPDSAQAQWIRDNAQRLQASLTSVSEKEARHVWAKKFGPFAAPMLVLLASAKWLVVIFKLKFLLSLGTFVAFYWALYGMKFGIGFAVLILVHEMGHFIDIKRRGLPAEMPVFLPGLGAYVRWTALGVSTRTRAAVSLAGPFAGCLAAVVCALLWVKTGTAIWAALASLSAMLNVLNLIPVWVLDGGGAVAALDKTERIILAVAAVLLAALFSQPLLLLVAAGAAYRVFTKDIPAAPSHGVTLYYLLVLAALGYLMTLAPMIAPGRST